MSSSMLCHIFKLRGVQCLSTDFLRVRQYCAAGFIAGSIFVHAVALWLLSYYFIVESSVISSEAFSLGI